MEISAQAIRGTEFKTVKKGYDPDEVDAFKDEVAAAIESAQGQAAAMESRARAAVARLQEVSQQAAAAPREMTPPSGGTPSGGMSLANAEDAEVISRTLVLAQRTADTTVASARAEAEAVTSSAREEASRVVDNARGIATKMVEDAKAEARRSKDDELARAENEVQALLARRDFLLGDVDQLEQYIQAQRERLREAALDLQDIVDRVPGGLADLRRPLMSAAAEPLTPRQQAAADPTPAGLAAPAPATPDDVDDFDDDDDPMSLFASSEPASAPLAFPGGSRQDPWSVLDDQFPTGEVPITQAGSRHTEDTAEVPVIRPGANNDPFRIGGDELR